MTQLSEDRALAMRTLMPRAWSERTTNPATYYRDLTRSAKAEVDRLVDAFREVRQRALADFTQTPPPVPCGTPWPPSLHDVTPVHCRLPRGHRSAEHWHDPLWPGTDHLVWVDPEPADTDA